MQERISRDIVQKIGEEKFIENVKNRKRKFADAFPELNISNNSDSSN